eukprot:scaffold5298_cov131-Isochrysis_galbana.AAC.9
MLEDAMSGGAVHKPVLHSHRRPPTTNSSANAGTRTSPLPPLPGCLPRGPSALHHRPAETTHATHRTRACAWPARARSGSGKKRSWPSSI